MGFYQREAGEYEWCPGEIGEARELQPGRAYDIKYAKYVEEVLTPARVSYKPTARILVQSDEPTDRIYDKLIVDQMIMGEAHRQHIQGQLESILDPEAPSAPPVQIEDADASQTEETVAEDGNGEGANLDGEEKEQEAEEKEEEDQSNEEGVKPIRGF